MNTKKSVFERKHVVEILYLILRGEKTNKKISDKLGKKPPTISERLNQLARKGIVSSKKIKNDKEKDYEINYKKLSEYFLEYAKKKFELKEDLNGYKSNIILNFIIKGIISEVGDEGRLKKVTLDKVFGSTIRLLVNLGSESKKGKDFYKNINQIEIEDLCKTEDYSTEVPVEDMKSFLHLCLILYQEFAKYLQSFLH